MKYIFLTNHPECNIHFTINGYNSSLLCYESNGTGKTYSLMGPTYALYETNSEVHGLIPRLIKYLFDESIISTLINVASIHMGINLKAIEVDNHREHIKIPKSYIIT